MPISLGYVPDVRNLRGNDLLQAMVTASGEPYYNVYYYITKLYL